MRKHHRDMILEMLPTILDGVKYAKSNKEAAEAVLTDCWEAMEAISEMLESRLSAERFPIYNENTNAIMLKFEHLLEAITGQEPLAELSNEIKSRMNSLRKALEDESEVKLEIVFMPYNASMWDCMESIWLAAKEDSQCESYVVPLPYYDRNPDQSLGKLIYEGSVFPDYVPIVHYDTYDLESRQPDAIYIQNPYDEFNLVTSIEPRFYSYKLKKHTEKLIYVPYFVFREAISELYCDVSAVKHADIIIAQSEEVRKVYEKYAGKNKVVVLGSPKLDKVVNTKRENQVIPDDWKKLIEKSDGTRKKIVLYNTSVGSALKGDNQYLTKLRSVLNTFKSIDVVTLWWRPHPLSVSTYYSMRPQFLKEYLKIVDEYIREGWGIYDDTADLHRAIALSDAYYGDGSSLVPMYSATGKPVFLQDIHIENCAEYNRINISLVDFRVENGVIWGVPRDINGLVSINLKANTLEFYSGARGKNTYESGPFSSIVISGNNVVLAPFFGKSIVKYEINNRVFVNTSVENVRIGSSADSCQIGEDAYIIPYYYPALVKYNIETGVISENRRLCEELDKHRTSGNEPFFRKGAVVAIGDILIMASSIANIVVKYDTKTGKHDVLHIGNRNNKYMSIALHGNDVWLFAHKGSIVKWNAESGEFLEINSFPDEFVNGERFDFRCSVVYEESIFAFPHHSNMILRINTKENTLEPFANISERKKHMSFIAGTKYYHAETFNDCIYAFSSYENSMQEINPRTGAIQNILFDISDEACEKINSLSLFNPTADSNSEPWQMLENLTVNLPFFIERLATETINKNQITFDAPSSVFVNTDGTCGKRTHEYVTSRLQK